MLFTSTPINKNINNNKKEESKNDIINSEININNNPLLLKSKVNNLNDANLIQILNPFDSIASKNNQIQFQSFSNHNSNANRINNNRYSQVSNSTSINNSHINKEEKNNNNDFSNRYKQYNNFSYSSSNRTNTNKDINSINTHLNNNSRINDSNDIKFEIINNDEISNYKNNNNVNNISNSSNSNSNFSIIYNNNMIKKIENFNAIKESDEEDYNEANQDFLRAINLNDLESYVNKYKSLNININLNNKNNSIKNNYEINKRISDIINNCPFNNINISINDKNGEIYIDKLLTLSSIVYIKSLNNQQITEQFNKDFYEQILSAKKFSGLNANLHEDTNFDSSLISIGQLHVYNGLNKKLIGKKIRDIIDNDGNSFLKAFIFNYFENILADKNIDNVIFIIYIISTKLPLLNINNINVQEVLTILKIIFTHLEKENILEAYIVLINAFKENSYFEKGLIYFVKYCLKQFIIDNYVLFNIDYLNEIISKKYIIYLNNQFDYQNYIQEKIMFPQEDIKYEVLVYYLLPLIFPVNLIIYTNSNAKINKIIFKNKINNNKNKIYTIELNIKFGNTIIIYSDAYINNHKNIIPYTNDFNYPVDKLQKITNNKKDDISQNIFCKDCNTYPDNYIQVGPKIKPLCEKCLLNAINKVINKRYILLKEDLFLYEEFYSSKIKLTNALENNLYLSLNDIKILLPNHNELSEEIHKLIIKKEKCDICNRIFELSKYSICLYPCGHILCDKCFIKCINDITHKRIILNKFETKTENCEYLCPNPTCKNKRIKNLNYFIYKYFDNINDYIKKAEDRLITQAKNFCCICKKVSNKYNFDIKINNNKKILKHSICIECKKYFDNKKKINSKRNDQTKFMCELCDVYHIYDTLYLEKNKNKDKNESCCNIF